MTAVAAVAPGGEKSSQFRIIPLSAIHESKTNPRRHFDAAALKDLTDSIRAKGLIVPLLVRPRGAWGTPGHGDSFELVAGARRYRAAKAAGLTEAPALVRELDDKEALELQVIENLQRVDVHPLEEADGYAQLLKRHGYTIETLAGKVGKSPSYVYQRLKLAALVAPVQQAFLDGEISAGHAIDIARLQPKDQLEALKECRRERGFTISVRQLRQFITEDLHLDLKRAPFSLEDADLVKAAGACSACPKRAGNQPSLFPDVSKDTCTDRGCYATKIKALVARKRDELKAAKTEFVQVSGEKYRRWGESGPPLRDQDWKLGGVCKNTKLALIVEGEGQASTVKACFDKKCRKHWPNQYSYSGSGRPAETKEERKRKEKDRDERKARAAALPGVLKKHEQEFSTGIRRRYQQLRALPDDVALALATTVNFNGIEGRGRSTSHREEIQVLVGPSLPGKWSAKKPDDWRYLFSDPWKNAAAARAFIALNLWNGLDTAKLDAQLEPEIKAAMKSAATAPASVDPKTLACPNCRAKPGSPCKRPSGHPVFGGGFHSQREKAAQKEDSR